MAEVDNRAKILLCMDLKQIIKGMDFITPTISELETNPNFINVLDNSEYSVITYIKDQEDGCQISFSNNLNESFNFRLNHLIVEDDLPNYHREIIHFEVWLSCLLELYPHITTLVLERHYLDKNTNCYLQISKYISNFHTTDPNDIKIIGRNNNINLIKIYDNDDEPLTVRHCDFFRENLNLHELFVSYIELDADEPITGNHLITFFENFLPTNFNQRTSNIKITIIHVLIKGLEIELDTISCINRDNYEFTNDGYEITLTISGLGYKSI
jgi:hypothetical protein